MNATTIKRFINNYKNQESQRQYLTQFGVQLPHFTLLKNLPKSIHPDEFLYRYHNLSQGNSIIYLDSISHNILLKYNGITEQFIYADSHFNNILELLTLAGTWINVDNLIIGALANINRKVNGCELIDNNSEQDIILMLYIENNTII